MDVPLYGQADAAAIWYRTYNHFCTSPPAPDGTTTVAEGARAIQIERGLGYERCDQEPCIYGRVTGDGGRISQSIYVDDGRQYWDDTPDARKEGPDDLKKLAKRFPLKLGEVDPTESLFLGARRVSDGRHNATITATPYIKQMVDRYLDGDDSVCEKRPAAWSYTPASEELMEAFKAAVAEKKEASKELVNRYAALYGSLLHVTKYRPEVSAALGYCGTCLTFPTEELYRCLTRILVYLSRTRNLGTRFTGKADDAKVLRAYADANWDITRSVTGFLIMLAGGTILSCSKRQHCISMSSCESELIALADCAIELLYILNLLEFLGFKHDGPVDVCTDNKGAFDLCHRFASAQHTRHIDRKLFKMRELRGAGKVNVRHVPTESNPADIFTKILGRQLFERHRATALNLPGKKAEAESTVMKERLAEPGG